MPSLTDLIASDASIDDHISALEDLLITLEPRQPAAAVTVPAPQRPAGRLADLHRAKLLIDEAIVLLTPHFTATPRR